ncbi:helix-turn-helix domain-containing protein [Salinactinospora qingdaonensis]|uniref:Helix-turn-helix transcriptional regulator n=1 Tax=Salinactinospora qingdaonensis TaxID=702744 RepID=A0ABP7GLE3_9ACTN
MRRTPSPSVRLRRLGRELRRLRETRGLSVAQAAKAVGWGSSKLSRFETAERRITAGDLDKLLNTYKIEDGVEREALQMLAKQAKERGWWWKYRDVFGARALPDFEAEASVIRTYESIVIPGLLQTPNYATALFQGDCHAQPEQIDRLVEARLARREIMTRIEQPPRLTAVIDEAALRRPIGGREVMREQLDYLLRIGQAHNIDLHVLPFVAGAHSGLSGSFTILDFPEPTDLSVVYTDTLTSGAFEEQIDDVDRYMRTFGDLQGSALSKQQSEQFIRDVLQESENSA